jgi:hypothetical protein
MEDSNDCYVGVALDVQEDGNVDVQFWVGHHEFESLNVLDASTSPYPPRDILDFESDRHIEGKSIHSLPTMNIKIDRVQIQ